MSDIQAQVEQAMSQETFSFVDFIQGRGYPRDEVVLNMDEATAYKIQKLEKQKKDDSSLDESALDRIDAEIASLREVLAKSALTFKVVGLSTENREELLENAREQVKPEYESNRNFITGQVEKVEKESPARDRLYTNLLWKAQIEQIVAPNGAVTVPTLEDIEVFRNKAPQSQQLKLARALGDLAVASEAFEAGVSDD